MSGQAAYTREELTTELQTRYKWDYSRASQAGWIAKLYLLNSEPIKGGIADIVYHPQYKVFTLTERV